MQRIRVTVKQLEDRHQLTLFSSRIGVISQLLKRPGKAGRRSKTIAGYFGFPDYDSAAHFAGHIRNRFPKAMVCIRKGQRLTTVFEVKVSRSEEAIELLATEALKQTPTTGQHIERHLQVVKSRPSVQADKPTERYRSPVASRSRPATATVGNRTLSID